MKKSQNFLKNRYFGTNTNASGAKNYLLVKAVARTAIKISEISLGGRPDRFCMSFYIGIALPVCYFRINSFGV